MTPHPPTERAEVAARPIIRSKAMAWLTAATVTGSLACAVPAAASAPQGSRVEGTLPSGDHYLIEVPAGWRGTLLVWSPGYVSAAGRPTSDAPDATTRQWLLDHGYALAGSQPATVGWAVADIMPDAVATLDEATARFGAARRTIAWGASMGGQVTAGLAQTRPDRLDGALPLCGSVAGPVAMLNAFLDSNWALKQLVAPGSDLELVHISDENTRQQKGKALLDSSQASAQGRARIALAASFSQLSTWSVASDPKPAPRDYAAQETQQYQAFISGAMAPRQPLEQRAGGNFSWNVGVDYGSLFARSGRSKEVAALYKKAGLSLKKDLSTLAAAPRIKADPAATDYMRRNITPTGEISDPVLTLNETGDNAPTVVQASAYAAAVRSQGNRRLLRQAFVDRPGHCGYKPSEVIASLLTLERRITTGIWPSTNARTLSRLAAEIDAGSPLDLGTAGFVNYRPGDMLRPYRPASK
jgi:pimeloyl-ACP methyl ester carboxylesterase